MVAPARLEKPQKNPNRAALRQSRRPFRNLDFRAHHSATLSGGLRLETWGLKKEPELDPGNHETHQRHETCLLDRASLFLFFVCFVVVQSMRAESAGRFQALPGQWEIGDGEARGLRSEACGRNQVRPVSPHASNL